MWFQYHVAKVKFFNVCPICIIKFHNIWVKNGMLRIKYSFIWKRIILLNIAIFQILSFKVVISWYWQNNTLMWEWSEVVCERFGSFNQKEKIIFHSKFRENTDLSVQRKKIRQINWGNKSWRRKTRNLIPFLKISWKHIAE